MYQYRLGSFHVAGTVECNPDEPHYQGLLVTTSLSSLGTRRIQLYHLFHLSALLLTLLSKSLTVISLYQCVFKQCYVQRNRYIKYLILLLTIVLVVRRDYRVAAVRRHEKLEQT